MSTDPSSPPSDPLVRDRGRTPLDTGDSKPSGQWLPPTAEELHAILPQYEIVKMLGRGGMGAVYMGRQISLDRPVAIKILSNTLDEADASFAERFKNEAKAMGKLNHPGIVSVYAFGETEGGLLYIVMEFVDGTDVSRMITASGRLHTEHAMAITAHVCDALAYAHERGIIHRDIKPANIMVAYDGTVKVADFGLAKMTHSQNTGLTQSGMAMGTLHYMAPEALTLGSAVDHRADIYAVGVMLFQMLTGKVPHGMFKLPSLQIPGLDPRYDGVIAKAIMEDREARYQRVVELRRDLDGILTQPVVKVEADASHAPAALPTQARPQRPAGQPHRPPQRQVATPRPQPSSNGMLMWTILAAALVAGGAWWLKHTATPAPQPLVMPVHTSPAPLTLKDAYTNSLGMKFVPVPGTNVLFCIHEVRYQDYAAYAAESPGVDDAWKDQNADGFTPTDKKEQHPVMKVSWEDAQAFCAWLSKREGKTYRLPTDQEWSIAVGIGDETWQQDTTPATVFKNQTEFPWGTQWPPPQGSGNYSDASRKAKAPKAEAQYLENHDDGFPTTAPVMSFQPNKLGIYDLEGNVREWVDDWYDNSKKDRFLRGGCWGNHDRGNLFSSSRNHYTPGYRHGNSGFRLVLMAQPTAQSPVSKPAPEITAARTPAPTSLPTATASSSPAPLPTSIPQPVFTNTLGMKFVPLPGTRILMCIHETRRMDYEKFAAETPGLDDQWRTVDLPEVGTHPVSSTSWNGAKAFCEWLSKREGRAYRLPTDREWSIAVGTYEMEKDMDLTPEELSARNTDVYPWGKQWPPPPGAGNYADESFFDAFQKNYVNSYRDGFATTSPVMSFPPNQFGIYDLCGNLWEFCEDWLNEKKERRVLRGGHFSDYKMKYFAASHRAHRYANTKFGCDGFRVVIEDYLHSTSKAASVPSLPAAPVVPIVASATTWVDTQNRSLGAKFVRLEASNVVLDIRGKKTPVPMASLSSASQQIARDLAKELEPDLLRQATKDKPFVNSLGMKFVPLPGTSNLICIHETRRADYAKYATENQGISMAWSSQFQLGVPVSPEDSHPVTALNWHEAIKFCSWLSRREGRHYRITSDREWSIAIGIASNEDPNSPIEALSENPKTGGRYVWGTRPRPTNNVGNFADSAFHDQMPMEPYIEGFSDGFATTSPVMSFKPNSLGIYDLGVNVWEWCSDRDDAVRDTRILRGSSWGTTESGMSLASFRFMLDASDGRFGGFRVVLELP
jgi:formylglycine-generating enzyme required for sulfatase activity